MRKEDITVTDSKHSTIYAIGTAPESNSSVWADHNTWPARRYTPGYVLEVESSGFVVALVSETHPDSERAQRFQVDYVDNTPVYTPQASALEALSYGIEDVRARTAVMAEYSHWPLSEEQRQIRDSAVAALKPLPLGWNPKVFRATYVRMLWAEYATRLDAVIGERRSKEDADKAERDALKSRKRASFDAILKLDIGLDKKNVEYLLNQNGYNDHVELPIGVIENLLIRAEAGMLA